MMSNSEFDEFTVCQTSNESRVGQMVHPLSLQPHSTLPDDGGLQLLEADRCGFNAKLASANDPPAEVSSGEGRGTSRLSWH